jgi:hypothetical protein
MRTHSPFAMIALATLFFSCAKKTKPGQQLVVKNTMNTDRTFETVSVALTSIKMTDAVGTPVILDAETQSEIVSQLVDTDGDGKVDELLFQPEIAANSEKTFTISFSEKVVKNDSTPSCYSRFVPERTDDYAWENNRVAFRTYGPTAQKMVEDGVKGGTLSSGMDAWLKRVQYPIINNWYYKELETEGSYHTDNGEGLDNYHVGISRGIGGIAKKVDTTYHISRNFVSWKTLSTGPIRTSFILTYADWDAASNIISEEKKISLDYGSNLSKFEVQLKGTDTISAGITLHDNLGEIHVDVNDNWISHWEPHHGTELGTGIVVPNNRMVGHEQYVTDRKDESNLFAHIQVANNSAVYYAGFAWSKSNQFPTKEAWESYLSSFAERLANPLTVTVN